MAATTPSGATTPGKPEAGTPGGGDTKSVQDLTVFVENLLGSMQVGVVILNTFLEL